MIANKYLAAKLPVTGELPARNPETGESLWELAEAAKDLSRQTHPQKPASAVYATYLAYGRPGLNKML